MRRFIKEYQLLVGLVLGLISLSLVISGTLIFIARSFVPAMAQSSSFPSSKAATSCLGVDTSGRAYMALSNGQIAISNGSSIIGTADANQLVALSQPYCYGVGTSGDINQRQNWVFVIRRNDGWYKWSMWMNPASGFGEDYKKICGL